MDFSKTLQDSGTYLRAIAESLINKYQHKTIAPATQSTPDYASGDVVFAAIEVPNVALEDTGFLLSNVLLTDNDDIAPVIDLVFLKSAVAVGAVNAAYAFPAASISELLGVVSIASGDWSDLGAFRTAEKKDLNLVLTTPDNSKSIWVVGVARAAINFSSASGLRLNLGLRRS